MDRKFILLPALAAGIFLAQSTQQGAEAMSAANAMLSQTSGSCSPSWIGVDVAGTGTAVGGIGMGTAAGGVDMGTAAAGAGTATAAAGVGMATAAAGVGMAAGGVKRRDRWCAHRGVYCVFRA